MGLWDQMKNLSDISQVLSYSVKQDAVLINLKFLVELIRTPGVIFKY